MNLRKAERRTTHCSSHQFFENRKLTKDVSGSAVELKGMDQGVTSLGIDLVKTLQGYSDGRVGKLIIEG